MHLYVFQANLHYTGQALLWLGWTLFFVTQVVVSAKWQNHQLNMPKIFPKQNC